MGGTSPNSAKFYLIISSILRLSKPLDRDTKPSKQIYRALFLKTSKKMSKMLLKSRWELKSVRQTKNTLLLFVIKFWN
jgi:hypothetical protein